MMKIVVVGTTALFLTASPVALAQTPSPATQERLNAADRNTLLDLRIDLTKAALQLRPKSGWRVKTCPVRHVTSKIHGVPIIRNTARKKSVTSRPSR